VDAIALQPVVAGEAVSVDQGDIALDVHHDDLFDAGLHLLIGWPVAKDLPMPGSTA
jgi:hypothetical protein